MEQDLLNGVAWLDEIRSESVPGLSRIQLIFEPGTGPHARAAGRAGAPDAGARAAERLQAAADDPAPVVDEPGHDGPAVLDGAHARSRCRCWPAGRSSRACWASPASRTWPIWGQRERQLQVQVDPEQLRAIGVSLLDVIETTGNALWVSPLTFLEASTPGTGGFIDTPNQRLGVQHLLPIKTAEDLAQVPLEVGNRR